MYDAPMRTAVNEFLLRPDALEVVGGIVAAGLATLSIRELIKYVGAPKPNREQAREVDLLDEAKPPWLLPDAVGSVHASLLAQEMRGGGPRPKIGWSHGIWNVRWLGFRRQDPMIDPEAMAYDLTDITTPLMDEHGRLV